MCGRERARQIWRDFLLVPDIHWFQGQRVDFLEPGLVGFKPDGTCIGRSPLPWRRRAWYVVMGVTPTLTFCKLLSKRPSIAAWNVCSWPFRIHFGMGPVSDQNRSDPTHQSYGSFQSSRCNCGMNHTSSSSRIWRCLGTLFRSDKYG